jgi:hypothetical protein
MGDEKPSPGKGKGGTRKSTEGTKKHKQTVKTNSTTPKACKNEGEDKSDEVGGTTTKKPAKRTPTKRAHDGNADSETEGETPTKLRKTEIKEENDY